jgi:hypothetical protein
VANVGEGGISIDWIYVSSEVMATKLLEPVVDVIWRMVNMRLPAIAAEAGMMTILLAWEAVCTPST